MRDVRLLLASLALVCLAAGPAPADAERPRWHTDYAKAEAEARQLDRPLLVHFYSDSCAPCRRMERETLNSPEFRQQLGDRFVAVKVNGGLRENLNLVSRFKIRAFPSDVFIEPDGRIMVQTSGYQDQKTYLGRMARMEAQFARTHKTYIAKAPAGADDEVAAPTPPVMGLDGYSPVSLWNWREWRRGKKDFPVVHQGMRFYLASVEEVRQFEAEPDRYMPELLGCDPVVLWETERAVPGSTKFGAYFDGELYLFRTAETRQRFKENPKQFIETRHVLYIDQIEKTELR